MSRAVSFVLFFALLPAADAGDWPMFSYDPQRTGWAREEKILNKDNVSRLRLQWKTQLKNEPKSLTALTAPIVLTGVETESGAKDLVYVGGSGDVFYALDAADGSIVWEKEFKREVNAAKPGFWLCPKGLNATPLADRKTNTIYAISSDGRLYAMDPATGKEKYRSIQFVPPMSKNWSLNQLGTKLYTSVSQNCGDTPSGVVSIDIADPVNPVIRYWRSGKFQSGIWGRGGVTIGRDGLIFGATGDGKFSLEEREFGESVVALDPDSLKLFDHYTPSNWEYVYKRDFDIGTSVVAFIYRNRELVAVGGKEGLVYLMDGSDLGGADHHSCLYTTPLLSNQEEWFEAKGVWGGLSFYRDEQNRHWIYVPTWGPMADSAPDFPQTNGPNPNGSVMAFVVEDNPSTRKPYLKPMWVSGDMSVPEPVAVANGVVFVLSNGENVRQSAEGGIIDPKNLTLLKDDQRRENATQAELRALDAQSGKLLYDSGPGVFETWAHFSGIAVAKGRVYAVDYSSTLFCFGLR